MCYPDWLLNGSDAWVAVLGAPMRSPKDFKVSRTLSSASLGDVASGRSCWSWNSSTTGAATSSSTGKADPWAEENAYLYSVVLGNEGRPLNRLVDVADAKSALREVVLGLLSANLLEVAKALPKGQPPKLVVYAHGGGAQQRRRVDRSNSTTGSVLRSQWSVSDIPHLEDRVFGKASRTFLATPFGNSCRSPSDRQRLV